MAVEPFVHSTVSEVNANTTIDSFEKNKKLYYSEWENTLQSSDIINLSIEELKSMLDAFVDDKLTQLELRTVDDVSNDNDPVAIKLKSQAELRGSVGGVTALIQLQQSVAQGYTSYDAGVEIIKENTTKKD